MQASSKASQIELKKEIKLLSANSTFEIRKHLLQCFQIEEVKDEQEETCEVVKVTQTKKISKIVNQLLKSVGKVKLIGVDQNIAKLVSVYEIFKRSLKEATIQEFDIVIKKRKLENDREEICMEIPFQIQSQQ